jgi:hypothetical protein
MSRDHGWWGTRPLVVGLIGLALLAFGANALPDLEAINAPARQEAAKLQVLLRDAQSQANVFAILRSAEGSLEEEGKRVDLRALVPRNELESDPGWIDKVGEAYYQARSVHRDAWALLTGRLAFYVGLILVFAAGVLLYRRTPDSVHNAW